jgi:hypothetical protein
MFDDLIENIDAELSNRNAAIAAATSVFAIHKPRIFEEGRDAEDGKIGDYKEGPYKKKKAKMGRETSFVNLSMTESMKKDYQVTDRADSSSQVGFGFSNINEFNKSEWLEGPSLYDKKIFWITEKEASLYVKLLADKLGFK